MGLLIVSAIIVIGKRLVVFLVSIFVEIRHFIERDRSMGRREIGIDRRDVIG